MATVVPSPSPSLSSLVPGGVFRQYQLLEQIGVGGQAVVWSALSQSLDRIYAIKFNKILDSDFNKPEELGIEQKLERLVRLQHAHILPVHDYGSEEGVRFLVSPYIPGGTLTGRIRTAPLSFEQVLHYGTEIASALDYLHSQGVIHRDLKSSNILLDLSDHTYLADFGLARLVSTSTLAFHTGHGTPPYAPPEQIRGKEITSRSDIFSFGILLFEMFTGQLPWNGQKQLGVEQLNAAQELPDPREYVTGLPPLITDVLRRVTSADPEQRPRTASEVMRMVRYVFKAPAESLQDETPMDELAARDEDAKGVLRHGLAQWEETQGKSDLGLTKFALVDLECREINTDTFKRFMLSQALTYGYNDDRWWATVSNPGERLMVSSILLRKDNDVIAGRILKHMMKDAEILAYSRGLPESIAKALLAVGLNTNNAKLRQHIFAGMQTLVRPGSGWKDGLLNPDQSQRLAELALEDSRFGDTAAALIGHLRPPAAVRVILDHSDDGRKIGALLLIQQVAGSLPSFVPAGIRLRLSLEWALHRLIQRPVSLIGGYVMAFLGAAIGIGLQVYLTLRFPTFLDVVRLTNSLEQGLIMGSMFGLGIFLPRVVTERFHASNPFLRVFFGTLAGSVMLNITLLIFHMLFVKTPPRGSLITLGCVLIALCFAIGGLMRSRLIKIFLSSAAIFAAIVGTWLLHVNLATSARELTPIFRYEYTWPLTQVLLTALAVAFPIGILGNLVNLSIKDDHP